MRLRVLATFALLFAVISARADQLILNGGFESGLTGWTTSSTGDGGFTVVSGTTTPLTYNTTVGAHSGTYYAVSDDYNGSQVQYLTQSFTTPGSIQTATLTFAIFVNDIYGSYFGSSGPGGQVTLLNAAGAPIVTLYGPEDTFENPGTPNPYVTFSQDIASYLSANTSYALQFSNSDAAGLINVGVDDVSLVTTAASVSTVTPEPSTFSLFAVGAAFVMWFAGRKSIVAEA